MGIGVKGIEMLWNVCGEQKELRRPIGSAPVHFLCLRTVIFLVAGLVAVGQGSQAAEENGFLLSPHAERALDLYGLREMADRPLPPSTATDEATSRALQAHILYLSAQYFLAANRLEQARIRLEEAAKILPDNYYIQLSLAMIDGRTFSEQRAIQTCDRLIKAEPTRIDAYELKGRILEASRRPDEAIAVYSEAIKHWPNCDSLVTRLLETALRRGDLDLAIEICKGRLEREPRHFNTLWTLGHVCAIKAQTKQDPALFRESARYYEKALEVRPRMTKIYPSLAEVYSSLRERDKALATLRRGVIADPSDQEMRTAFEKLVSPSGNNEEILAAYRTLAEEYPTSVEILDLYAAQLAVRQKFREAHEQYERLLKIQPNDVKTLLVLGGLDLQLGNADRARDQFERAIEVAGDDAKTYEAIGNVYFHSKRFDQAIEIFDKALARDPKRMEIYLVLARAYQEMGKTDKAIEVYQRALAAITQSRSQKLLFLALGALQQQQKQYSDAIASVRKAYELDRTDTFVFFALAHLLLTADDQAAFGQLLAQGRETFRNSQDEFQEKYVLLLMEFHRYAEAIPELQVLIGRHPDRWQLYAHLATAYQRLRQSANGERLLEDAREHLNAERGDFHRFAARYYSMHYEHHKAYEALQKLLGMIPVPRDKEVSEERMTLYGSLIFNLARMKKYDEIAKVLARVESEIGDRDAAEMKTLRARALGETKHYDEAIAAYQELLKDDPDNVQLQYELGSVLNEAKRNDEAEKTLRRCLEQLPKAPINPDARELRATVLNHLGYMFAEQGINLDESEKFLTEALELQPRAGHIVDSMGWCRFQKGQTEQAIGLLKKALDYSSEDPTLYDHLGDAYAKSGDAKKALECWRESLRLDPDQAEVKAKITTRPKK